MDGGVVAAWVGIGGTALTGVVWSVRQEGRINLIEKLYEQGQRDIVDRLERIERNQDVISGKRRHE